MRILTINQPTYINNYAEISSSFEGKVSNAQKKPDIEFNNGSAITIATLAAVAGIVTLSRGFQKNAGKVLFKLRDFLEKKMELSSLKKSKTRSKFYEYSINNINSFIRKSESINNLTSLKDILFMKLMYKTKPTKKIHQYITEKFEQLSRKTILDSYKKTENDFNFMYDVFDKLDSEILKNNPNEIIEYKGKKYTKKDLITEARSHRNSAKIIVDNFMSKDSLEYRYKYINDVTSMLYSKFWDESFKDFWSKNNKFKRKEMWQTFIAAEEIKGNKTELARGVALARNAISYTQNDKFELLTEYIKDLDTLIPPDNKSMLETVKKLQWFSMHSEGIINNRQMFNEELSKLKQYKLPNGDSEIVKTKQQYKDLLVELIDEFAGHESGELQDMLSIYYKLDPIGVDKSGAILALKKAVKSFDKSVFLENAEFFDKIRDLRLGSAPTDVLTIILSFITLSFGLGYAKDKDARNSIMLKSGIPIVGAICTATYSTTKLVSGGKSLALGILSGIVLNRLGIIFDNMRKQNRHKQNANTSQILS